MSNTATAILAHLKKKYAQDELVMIKNCADSNIETSVKIQTQYIIGVTPSDKLSAGISNYEFAMQRKLATVSPNVFCPAWAFDAGEAAAMKTALTELAEKLGADLNVEKIMRQLNINKNGDGLYYIVVTVVQYPIVYVE